MSVQFILFTSLEFILCVINWPFGRYVGYVKEGKFRGLSEEIYVKANVLAQSQKHSGCLPECS